jgi:hypothetical protein
LPFFILLRRNARIVRGRVKIITLTLPFRV